MHVTTTRFSSSRFIRSALAAPVAALPSVARAHGFGQRFDLPLPLWFWLSGAAATIVLTFVAVALFGRRQPIAAGAPRVSSAEFALPGCAGVGIAVLRVTAALIFLATLFAGFFGSQSPYANLINTMVWVIWWVGLAFVCALVGNVWPWLNPLDSLFAGAELLFARFGGRRLGLDLPYPSRLGTWPAVGLFFCFAWCELVWSGKDVPAFLATAVSGYAAITWLGMWLFGRTVWLRHGEAFAIVFALFGRFAPLALRRGTGARRHVLVVRWWGLGLMRATVPAWSSAVFVLLMLATVTFDGFKEIPAMQSLEAAIRQVPLLVAGLFELSERGLDESQVIQTIVLLTFTMAFVAALWLTSQAILALARPALPAVGPAARLLPRRVACHFVLSLVPIAVAYHLSHYFSLLLTAGQFIIPLASDPFGLGWNLLGSAGYRVDLALVSPYVLWYGAVVLIVSGHVIAVLLAHEAALRLFRNHRLALRSELPMTALMILYTMLSLWILAQPIVG
jgi:hypothetical protein